ncbi:MAG TPA: SdpI family protein [Mobilitalea sp.]|nr:SdpI family protein [Mobilitalea sp.]
MPVIMLLFGYTSRHRIPKTINSIYGYRTAMSMKNQDTWEFAHKCFGALWLKWGAVMFLVSMVVSIVGFKFNENVQGMILLALVTLQTIVIIASVSPVEKALKAAFDENGNRRIS